MFWNEINSLRLLCVSTTPYLVYESRIIKIDEEYIVKRVQQMVALEIVVLVVGTFFLTAVIARMCHIEKVAINKHVRNMTWWHLFLVVSGRCLEVRYLSNTHLLDVNWIESTIALERCFEIQFDVDGERKGLPHDSFISFVE